jgi:hypothetical protein
MNQFEQPRKEPPDNNQNKETQQEQFTVEVVRNATGQQILDQASEVKELALQFDLRSAESRGLDRTDARMRLNEVLAMLDSMIAKAYNIQDEEYSDDETKKYKEVVLIVAKNKEGQAVTINLLELFLEKKVATIPTDPEVGQFIEPETRTKYPAGSEVECTNTYMSLATIMQFQGRGLGKRIIAETVGVLKEMETKIYTEQLTKHTAKLIHWMKDEGLIKDFCRIEVVPELGKTKIPGVYLHVM